MAMLQSEEDPSRRQRLFETSQKHQNLLSGIEEVIVTYSANLTAITDRDVQEAVKSLKSTYRTEQKGVIYEHASSNPLVQALLKEVRSFMEEYRTKSSEKGESLRITDLVACLEFVELDVGYHLANESVKDSYLRFIARTHPDAAMNLDGRRIILAP